MCFSYSRLVLFLFALSSHKAIPHPPVAPYDLRSIYFHLKKIGFLGRKDGAVAEVSYFVLVRAYFANVQILAGLKFPLTPLAQSRWSHFVQPRATSTGFNVNKVDCGVFFRGLQRGGICRLVICFCCWFLIPLDSHLTKSHLSPPFGPIHPHPFRGAIDDMRFVSGIQGLGRRGCGQEKRRVLSVLSKA